MSYRREYAISFLLIFGLLSQIGYSPILSATANPDSPVSGAMVIASNDNGYGFNVTQPNGKYLIPDGLASGIYNVSTYAEGYINQNIGGVPVTVGSLTANINFNLKRSGGISGKVTDSVSGVGVAKAMITAYASQKYGWFAQTDSNGNYKIITNLETGIYNITVAIATGYNTKTIGAISVTAGVETKNVNFSLDRSATISGKVLTPTGQPVSGVTVSAISTGSPNYSGYAITGADGSYKIQSGLGTGTYMVTVFSGTSFDQKPNIAATVGQETTNVNLTLNVTVQPTGIITGTVTNSDNSPIVGATVSAGSGHDTTDSEGFYQIASGLPTGTYTVDVSAPGYQAQEKTGVSVTAGSTTSGINFKLVKIPAASSGKISGVVVGEDSPLSNKLPNTITCTPGKPSIQLGDTLTVSGTITPAVVGASVKIDYKSGTTELSRTATTGSDGKYSDSYAPLAAGSWTVEASWVGNTQYNAAGSETSAFTVTTPSVTTGGVKITVLDKDSKPLVGATVSSKTTPLGQAALNSVSGTDGSVSFSGVAAGAYTFEASRTGYVNNSGAATVTAGSIVTASITLQTQSTGGGGTSGGGVPGYPTEVIVSGIILAVIILQLKKRL
jgi:hypothetical protein